MGSQLFFNKKYFPLYFTVKISKCTEKLKEFCRVHPYTNYLSAAMNIFAIFDLSHIYPPLYSPTNAPFDTFQSKLQKSIHFTPKHFNSFMLNLDSLPEFKIRRF